MSEKEKTFFRFSTEKVKIYLRLGIYWNTEEGFFMEGYNKEKAEAVWRRVRGETDQAPPEEEKAPDKGLLGLIAGEWEDSAIYLQLARRLGGRESAVLRQMFQQEQAHIACLKGIYTLITGETPQVQKMTVSQEPVELTLRRCYGREMRCLAAYEARQKDPEYGQVFARLAAQEREHCRLVLELLGNLKRR